MQVLGGGKAYCHGIEVGDILSGINGENASNMTISRARHLVRTSDDLLVLEVTRSLSLTNYKRKFVRYTSLFNKSNPESSSSPYIPPRLNSKHYPP